MNVYQTVAAFLPGFCFAYVRGGFLPSRRIDGDARQILEALTLTGIFWAAAEIVLLAVHGGILLVGWPLHQSWSGPSGFLPSVLDGSAPHWQAIATISAMNVGALMFGFASVRWQRPDGNAMRMVSLGNQQWDPNPRVWSWWLARPAADPRGFRVILKSGRILVGQIVAFSDDPNDDVQEIVIRGISEIADGEAIELIGVDEMLINREEIAAIEMLTARPTVSQPPSPNADLVGTDQRGWRRQRRRRSRSGTTVLTP